MISVRNKNFGLPFRQYIWQGGTSKQDLNGDGLFKKLDNDPRTTGDVVDPIDENAVPWCFAYGEEEWLKRVSYQDAFEQSERFQFNRNKANDTDRRTVCL